MANQSTWLNIKTSSLTPPVWVQLHKLSKTFAKKAPGHRVPKHPTDPWVQTSVAQQSAFAPQGQRRMGIERMGENRATISWFSSDKVLWKYLGKFTAIIYMMYIYVYTIEYNIYSWSLYALPTRRHSPLRLQRPLHSVKPRPTTVEVASCCCCRLNKICMVVKFWSMWFHLMPSCSWTFLKSLSIPFSWYGTNIFFDFAIASSESPKTHSKRYIAW